MTKPIRNLHALYLPIRDRWCVSPDGDTMLTILGERTFPTLGDLAHALRIIGLGLDGTRLVTMEGRPAGMHEYNLACLFYKHPDWAKPSCLTPPSMEAHHV